MGPLLPGADVPHNAQQRRSQRHQGGLGQEDAHVGGLAQQQVQPLGGGEVVLGIVEDQFRPVQKHGNAHVPQQPGHKGQRADQAGGKGHQCAHRDAGQTALAPAAAQKEEPDKDKGCGKGALREGKHAQAEENAARDHPPQAAVVFQIAVEAEEGRHRKVELLGDVVGAQKPFGGVDKEGQRRQEGGLGAEAGGAGCGRTTPKARL